ncbi:hypothetical protein SLH49_02675 [Cognatiyoonia sp. IB215446]|uniref:hypothetical protein n=1 Tax=Cognatiyoonia sp. IB215446 TaxID=3097355 RepID=UPI002A0AB657|nr:hypothetical protein [Cognatiyoonia sp. IB215446]MDX8346880.1 hypothetical protein [Cognatiyoonia sp. IB215446]
MATIVLVDHDLKQVLTAKAKPSAIKLEKKIPIKIALQVDGKGNEAVDKDPLLQAKITKPATKSYQTLVITLASDLMDADKRVQKAKTAAERQKIVDIFTKTMQAKIAKHKTLGEQKAIAAWGKVKKEKREYLNYKLKAVYELGSDALSLTVDIASIPASGGLSAVLAGIKAFRTIMKMSLKLYQMSLSANKMQKKVKKHLETLKKQYNGDKKELSGLKGTLKAAANKIIGAKFITTIDSVKSENDQYEKTLLGVKVNSHKVAKELNKLLKFLDTASKNKDVKSSKKTLNSIEKMNDSVRKLLDRIITMQETAEKGDKFIADTKIAINEIENIEPSKWKYIKKGLVLVDIMLEVDDYSSVQKVAEQMGEAAIDQIESELKDRMAA